VPGLGGVSLFITERTGAATSHFKWILEEHYAAETYQLRLPWPYPSNCARSQLFILEIHEHADATVAGLIRIL
jgi:hypothetical protein